MLGGSVRVLPFIFCSILLMGAAAAWAYDEVQVTDGGMIAGKVTMVGAKPTPKGFNLIHFPTRSTAGGFQPARVGAFCRSLLLRRMAGCKVPWCC